MKDFSIAVFFLYEARKPQVNLIHSHFLSFPATVTQIMSWLSGIPYSSSAHAHDIYTTDRRELVNKIRGARFIVTCTRYNKNYLSGLVDVREVGKINVVYHGIDLEKWPKKNKEAPISKGNLQIKILLVARLIEKKGIIYLLQALRILKSERNCDFRCTIVGDGPLRESLALQAKEYGLNEVVQFVGSINKRDVVPHFLESDIFVLPCLIGENGDRDGLPNVLLEAMAVGLPVISTYISAISELIQHERTGLLVPEKDSEAIAICIFRLLSDKELYCRLVEHGRLKVREFDLKASTEKLKQLFEHESARENKNSIWH